ncbi:hypothetical protein NUH88_20310 [Nisaea acidiphila]|uniref:Uncharacterized protein n=1 Tax=Nisaea acidiphila TaxID=1862145 RepID=A0A9J7AQR0_9PROT|nr:hypothetical protein [Nisaea acidiphila]UUX49728.1 hypothetical protein NUH88_20310 [Nisaea acidiphila]
MANQSTTATHFWPASFEERGVAVPFTTPSVAMARVRKGERGRLELLIPGLSGGRGVYIIGWQGVPETFKLTVFDRVLHENIDGSEEITPEIIRHAVIRASATGLAGESAAEFAYRASTRTTEDQVRISLALTQHVVKAILDTELELSLAALSLPSGQEKVQSMLGRISRMLNIPAETLSNAMTEWGDLLEALGVPGYQPAGRLRKILANADHFLNSIRDWMRTAELAENHPANLIVEVLNETYGYWQNAFDEIDALAGNPSGTLKNWAQCKQDLLRHSKRLEWLEDGWPGIFALWEDALRGDHEQRLAAIATILSGLPLLPRDAVDKNSHAQWQDFAKRLGLLAAQNEERGHGDIDLQSMLRQEMVLARSLG